MKRSFFHGLFALGLSVVGLGALLGCAGDPALDGANVDVDLETEVEHADWQDAEPGCEDVDPAGMTLAACEGEPLLGALVDEAGQVACVDALSVLLVDIGALPGIGLTGADPSPQPSHPGMSDHGDGTDSVGSTAASLRLSTDGARRDPTPTPVTEALHADPTPTPVVRASLRAEDRDDPTPTPIMRD